MLDNQLRRAKGPVVSIGLALLAAFMLSACVQSKAPLLAESKPFLGERFRLQLYENFVDGKALSVRASVFRWEDTRYSVVNGDSYGVKYLMVQPSDGNDFIIQASDEKTYMYLLGRKLADGTYRILSIDQNDVDDATRNTVCVTRNSETCTIQTREQLDIFVRAAAAKAVGYTMIALISAVDAQ